jgi:Skp family chaperone for outer membrane proteins
MKPNRVIVTIVGIAIAFVALAAFQGNTMKFGVVDLGKVAEDSKLGMRKRAEFDGRRNKMTALLQFVSENRVLSRAQGSQLKDLMLIASPTAAQQDDLKRLQDTIRSQKNELETLMRLTNPQPAQLQRANELSAMANEALEMARDWNQDFGGEMGQLAQQSQQEVIDKARAASQKVAQRGGFTLVFEASVAVYAANDITQDAIKQMDIDSP